MEGCMNVFKVVLVAAGIAALVGAGLREYPIFNGKLTSPMNANGFSITNVPNPVASGDIANRHYVDEAVSSATPVDYESVRSNASVGASHAGRIDNPHGVTALQIGALTSESDPNFEAFVASGGCVSNHVTIVDPGSASARATVADPGIRITEKGISGEWSWASIPGTSSGSWVNIPWSKDWSGLICNETDPTVPSWAKQSAPPSSMPDNGLVWTNGAVRTKSGTKTVGASDVGAATTASVAAADQKATAAQQHSEATRTIVETWEGFLEGSNVVFSITNYISGSYALDTAKLRIMEMRGSNYVEVYNSRGEILMHVEDFETNKFAKTLSEFSNNVETVIAKKADKAWGRYTSSGGEAPSNTVVMTETYTKFSGGTEYYRFAVGEGSIAVLATRGAPAYTAGDEGTFKFQDDGGTNYFGFAKSDSYVLGCNTDGISVSSGIVTLRYDVTMSGVPCIWYKASIEDDAAWEQLNLPDGSPIPGASHVVSWEMTPPEGQKVCYLNCSDEPQGFFKATIEVAGSAKFMTNMPADLGGGIICTNTASGVNGVIVPTYNGSTVIWTWRTF